MVRCVRVRERGYGGIDLGLVGVYEKGVFSAEFFVVFRNGLVLGGNFFLVSKLFKLLKYFKI